MLSKKILIDEDEGIIAMDSHHKQPARPSDAEITLIENYARRAQLGIEHDQDGTALIDSEERLRFVLEGSGLGFWDWNIDTNKIERNPAWAEIIGYSLEEIKHSTQHWTDFIYPDDRKKVLRSIKDTLDGGSINTQNRIPNDTQGRQFKMDPRSRKNCPARSGWTPYSDERHPRRHHRA